jgi:hypothetical protein
MQRNSNLFWGGVLILLGGLFAFQAAGWITDVFGWFWPLFLMLLGVMVLVDRFARPGPGSQEQFSVDLQGAARMMMQLSHGAGSVRMNGGAPSGVAVTGIKGLAMEMKNHLSGETLTVDLDAGPTFLPFLGPEGGAWVFELTRDVPVSVKVEAGAASLDFDFTDVRLEFLGVDTGASSLKLRMPAQAGRTLADIESGAATIDVTIPAGVAARIRMEQGASAQAIDQARFPALGGGIYQSPDFESAPNRLEINLEGGANSVTIR